MRNLRFSGAFSNGPKRGAMDDLNKTGFQDRGKINLHEPHELHYWAKHLNVSKEALQKAVDKVGNSAAAVRKELGHA